MVHCSLLLQLQLLNPVHCSLIYLITWFAASKAFLYGRQVPFGNTIERDTDESYLVEKVKVVNMIGSEDEAHKLGLHIVSVGLLEFSGLEVSVGIGIQ